MATIGLDNLYYSKITEDTSGDETYATPVKLARAIEASITIENYEAKSYSDDSPSIIINDFKEGSISLNIEEIPTSVAIDLFGCKKDKNGVIISSDSDQSNYVAIGFRSKKANGKYEYVWLYRVKFKTPSSSFKTKGDNIEFSTPTIEGTFTARNKLDASGIRPYKSTAIEDDTGVPSSVISAWFTAVHEPEYETTSSTTDRDTGGSN